MKKFKVPLPPALKLPDNIKPEQEFEVLAKVTLTKEGKLELVSFDGADVFDPEELEKEEAEREESLRKEMEEAASEYETESAGTTPAAITDEDGFMSAIMKDGRLKDVLQ
jgi:hypothetical protein